MTRMYIMHDVLRRELERIARVTARSDDDPKHIMRTAIGWELFKSFLHIHHTAEDVAPWPVMRQALARRPDELALLDAMEAEHAAIDPMLNAIDATLADRNSAPDVLGALTDALAAVLRGQHAGQLIAELERGRIHALPPSGPLDAATLRRCAHIVGMMGHEPIEQALRAGANVVLAGRATDTAVSAAFALMHGMPSGPTWHAAKVIECGGQCTTNPASGGVFARIDHSGFTIEFATSPAHIDRGAAYEFVLNHVVDVDSPTDMFRLEFAGPSHDC